MFTRKEKQLLGVEYFTLIREDERFIEVESKCAGHCWTVANAVANIKAHDKFVIDNLKYLEKNLR